LSFLQILPFFRLFSLFTESRRAEKKKKTKGGGGGQGFESRVEMRRGMHEDDGLDSTCWICTDFGLIRSGELYGYTMGFFRWSCLYVRTQFDFLKRYFLFFF
jgi:hypothetical protein